MHSVHVFVTGASKHLPGVTFGRRYFDNAHTRTQTWPWHHWASGASKWDKTAARAHGSRERTCAAAPVVDAAQGMLTRPPPAAPPWSDGCGSCHSLERCASAQNERTCELSSSSLRTSCPWPRSSSKRTACAGSNKALLAFSRRASLAPALTLHRTCANEGLLTAQRPTDGASAPPLLLCAADDFRFLAASVVVKFRRATPVFFCKGGARSNPSNRGDPFLASLRAIMGEGGMDKSAPPGAAARPPRRRGDCSCSASHF